MRDLDAFLRRTLKDLAALPEERMRLDLLAKRLEEAGAEDAARLLDALYRMDTAESMKAKALLVVPAALKNLLGSYHGDIYEASVRLGLKAVSRLFSGHPPKKTGTSGYEKEEEVKMEYISLGMRRQMAKSPVKKSLERLLADPDPVVIGNLLDNPRLTEKEVLKIASRRPNSERILTLIVSHRVWSKRYDVMKAVILNPYSPPGASVALLEYMLLHDLVKIEEETSIHEEVRERARELIGEKGGGRK